MSQNAAAAVETYVPVAATKVVTNTFVQGENFIEGTVKDILGPSKQKLRINGSIIGQNHLSALMHAGLVKEVGTQMRAPGVVGPRPAIIRIPTDIPAMKVVRR